MGRCVRIRVTRGNCRSGFHREGEEFLIRDEATRCPAICMELWHCAYPYVWALLNGAELDLPDGGRGRSAEVACPDGGRVSLHIEAFEE